MALEREARTNIMGSSLDIRNRNWDKVNAHLAEMVSQLVTVQRDLSLTGEQIVNLDFIPEIVIVDTVVFNTTKVSFGKATIEKQYQISYIGSVNQWNKQDVYTIRLWETSSASTIGHITINNDNTITISWTHTGDGATERASIYITALAHRRD